MYMVKPNCEGKHIQLSTRMTETANKYTSVALYRYMCQNIVGTEEHVKTIRMMNAVRDDLQSDNEIALITSGSFGEGLEMRGSDLDMMMVVKDIEVCEDANVGYKNNTIYVIMDTDDTLPGFAKLRLVHSNDSNNFEMCEEIGSDYYIPNYSLRERFVNKDFPIVHGPCLNTEIDGALDLVVCLRNKSWITPANEWITRMSNTSWPGFDVKQSVIKHGVLFVPIGVKGSTTEELEWRVSFSAGEKLLIYTFTHTQLLCYALMKILLKDVISLELDVKDLLCSYFMKTVMFWISEELSTSIWKPENLISCFMRCFRRLIYLVEYSVCPHYFIPKNNLFENKIKGKSQQILSNKLNILNSYGWRCILFSNQFSNFDVLAYGISKEPRCLHVQSVQLLLCSIMHYADNCSWTNNLILEKGIHRILSITSSKIKYLHANYMSTLCCKGNQFLPFDDVSDNKSTSKQYKTNIHKLLLSTRHDAVSGWLWLASLFYKRKEYKKAVVVLQYCLLECTPEKLYRGMNLSNYHEELFNLPSVRRMTTVQLLKFLHLECVQFFSNSLLLVPDELRIDGEVNHVTIGALIYVHFLIFLCNYHLHNTKQCLDSLRDLQLTIEKNYLIANLFQKAKSYNMLGILFQLVGDIESARHVFELSYALYPDPKVNDALRRLSLIG